MRLLAFVQQIGRKHSRLATCIGNSKVMRIPLLIQIVLSILVACGPLAQQQPISDMPTVQLDQPPSLPTGAKTVAPVVSPVMPPVSPIASSPVVTGEVIGTVSESPITPSDRQPAAEEELAEDVVIKFMRSGGFAGLNETFLIYADGRIVGQEEQERQVAPELIVAILQQIDAAGFFNLAESYLPRDTCCDRFIYQITVQKGSRTSTVITIDGAQNQPEGLTTTLAIITELLSSVGL